MKYVECQYKNFLIWDESCFQAFLSQIGCMSSVKTRLPSV